MKIKQKKISVLLFAVAMLLCTAYFLYEKKVEKKPEFTHRSSYSNQADQVVYTPLSNGLIAKVSKSENQSEAIRYIEDGILIGDPKAFDAALVLDGVCAPTKHPKWNKNNSTDKLIREVTRYCNNYTGLLPINNDSFKDANDLEAIYSKSSDNKTRVELDALREKYGDSAVKNELDIIIKTRDGFKIQAALQYAADEYLLPTSWQAKIPGQDLANLRIDEVLNTAGGILFCKYSSFCREGSLYSLHACFMTEACGNNISYMHSLKMSSSPKIYEIANMLAASP